MGVIKPPWISEKWFQQCPFNYCDHFGNKKLLATMCKICEEEVERLERYQREGKDPYSWDNVFEEVTKNLALTMAMIERDADRLGIDLDKPIEDYKEPPELKKYKIYRIVEKYGLRIERAIKELEFVPLDMDISLLKQAIDALSHSRFYILAKISRALISRFEERKDKRDRELQDSKTSAFLAYIAIERNGRAFAALAEHRHLSYLKAKHSKLKKLSSDLCELIREEFFPNEKLVYEEFGCDPIGGKLITGN